MKVKLLFILLLGLQTNLNAQVAHDYKQGCCKLVGAINSIESCYCAGCADTAKKNKEAKDAEDKRVKELSIKKAQEQRQAAIEKQKKENEAIAQKNNDAKVNTVHYGLGNTEKKTPKLEVKKEKIISDKRFQLKSNTRDGKAGFDDANGEPIFYSDEYNYTQTTNGANSIIYPVGYGVAFFRNEDVDIVDYKGNRILNDNMINAIFNIYDKWFLALNGYRELKAYSTDHQFSSGYFINIATGEKIPIPFSGIITGTYTGSSAYLDSGFDGLITNIRPITEYTGNKGKEMRYILSEFIKEDIQNWKALVKFMINDGSGNGAYYYIDKTNKLKKVDSSISFYELRRKYEENYGSVQW